MRSRANWDKPPPAGSVSGGPGLLCHVQQACCLSVCQDIYIIASCQTCISIAGFSGDVPNCAALLCTSAISATQGALVSQRTTCCPNTLPMRNWDLFASPVRVVGLGPESCSEL